MDKDKKPVDDYKNMREVFLFLFVVGFLSLIYWRLTQIFGSTFGELWDRFVEWFLENIWPWIKVLAVIVSALSIWGIYYSYKRLHSILDKELAIYGKDAPKMDFDGDMVVEQSVTNDRWEEIIRHTNSDNPAEWRQAILEADIMLDEMLRSSGYHGDSVGEKLKSVGPGELLSIESAWTAHKVRNRIAHDGASFDLTNREARATIAHFEAVFKEFKII